MASEHTVALTGAGVSTPSGIPDFRSPNSGLWQDYDPFQVASIYSFRRHPETFYEWIHPLAQKTASASPNAAHDALAQLEEYGSLKAIITQNIDMLHSRAGSENVLERGKIDSAAARQNTDIVFLVSSDHNRFGDVHTVYVLSLCHSLSCESWSMLSNFIPCRKLI